MRRRSARDEAEGARSGRPPQHYVSALVMVAIVVLVAIVVAATAILVTSAIVLPALAE
jgi:hypothetical protein